MRIHKAGEDYIKAIYLLQKEKGTVRSVDVAAYMDVTKPSVSHATRLLREGGFLTMSDDHSLHLTNLGIEIAEKMVERHQYFADRLTDAGVDADIAEIEACRMEHTISDDSFKKLREQEQKNCPFADACGFKPNGERVP